MKTLVPGARCLSGHCLFIACRNDSITGSYDQTKISFSYEAKYSIYNEKEFMGIGS